MDVTKIEAFPARRIDVARAALELAHKRLVRAAVRANQTAPTAPQLIITGHAWVSQCTECKGIQQGIAGGACLNGCGGFMAAYESLDLEIHADRPALAGWDFLAVVEPLTGGNLIRKVPGAELVDGELDRWRTGELACDQCRASRHRKETFIVRADGSDPAITAGTYKQVGRNCLAAFLGGQSAANIIARLGWESLVREAGAGDGEGGGWGNVDPAFEPFEFMAWVAASIRIAGFVSRAAANASTTVLQTTGEHVAYLLRYTPTESWRKARAKFNPTEADRDRGRIALMWAQDLPGANDYEHNLRLVARQPAIDPKHAGLLASAIQAHARVIGEQVKRATSAASVHLGELGEKKRPFGVVTLERVSSVETDYGTLHIHTFRDHRGNAIVWRTGASHGEPGQRFTLIGTVKKHIEFRNELQTELSHCKLVPVAAEQAA